MFQKVNDWLTERGERFTHGANAGRASKGAYYASSEAQQAYGRMSGYPKEEDGAQDTAGENATSRYNAESNDPYGGRVPYRSQKDIQAEAETRRQQAAEQARKQQASVPQGYLRSTAQPQLSAQAAQNGYTQPMPNNVLQFPGMMRGPEGNLYAHVEYIVLLRSRNECTKVIEYIKANASVFLNMEFIANDSERQRCVDMLSGAAYTLGCRLSKISQRGIYLISSPSVYVVVDPAMQKYTGAPETQSYTSAYTGPGAQQTAAYRPQQTSAYPAQQTSAYTAVQPNGYAAQQTAAYSAQQTSAYPAQQTSAYPVQQTTAYPAQPGGGYPAGQTLRHRAEINAGAQTTAYPAQPNTGFAAQQTSAYPAQGTQAYPTQQAPAYRTQRRMAGGGYGG